MRTTARTEGEAFDRAYLDAVLRQGREQSDVFGLRLMWESVAEISRRLQPLYPDASDDRTLFEAAFGQVCYLHLARRDKVAQAVSRLKAEQTGLWHVAADGSEREREKAPEPASYDRERLADLVQELQTHNAAWEHWFTQHAVTPVRISYEELAADPKTVLREILAALGLDPMIADSVEPATLKMADAESLDWTSRFRREGDLAGL